jgi:DinB family protein
MSNRPASSEGRYIDLVPAEDLIPALETQTKETESLLRRITEEKSKYRYAPEKWSIKTMLRHLTDTERIFGYRILAFARGESQPLPGFDENVYANGSDADERPWADLLEEWRTVRAATLAMLRGLSAEAWGRSGVAGGSKRSVRGIAYNTLGHERHHLEVLREKYGV